MALLCYYIVEKEKRGKKMTKRGTILTERIVREINISYNVQTGKVSMNARYTLVDSRLSER